MARTAEEVAREMLVPVQFHEAAVRLLTAWATEIRGEQAAKTAAVLIKSADEYALTEAERRVVEAALRKHHMHLDPRAIATNEWVKAFRDEQDACAALVQEKAKGER